MQKIKQSSNYKSILTKIIREASESLTNNVEYLNHSLNRTFAFAVFAFFDGDIQMFSESSHNHLFDCEKIEVIINKVIHTLTI